MVDAPRESYPDISGLLPCPFCGSTNIDPEGWMSVNKDGTQKTTGPACDECGGSTESVERWNSRTIETLRRQAFALSPAEQYRLAFFIAENVGYVLAREPEHPDSPHAQEIESVSHYVENYRFEFEDGRQYTPNEQDKALLEDAIEGWNTRTPQPLGVAQGSVGCGVSSPAAPDILAGLDGRLDRLLLTASDNSRFVLSTESAKNIVGIVREWIRSRGSEHTSTVREAGK